MLLVHRVRCPQKGLLRPNDLALFDVLGNVYEWCQESYRGYTVGGAEWPIGDLANAASIPRRVVRGGSYIFGTEFTRSAERSMSTLTDLRSDLGIRPARTVR